MRPWPELCLRAFAGVRLCAEFGGSGRVPWGELSDKRWDVNQGEERESGDVEPAALRVGLFDHASRQEEREGDGSS